jgi:integrase
MPLSDTQIRKSKPGPKPYKLSDGGGLYLWITPAGGKLWRWNYRHSRKQKTMTFGKYPDVSLAVARDRHREARAILATDVDPMGERKSEKRAKQVSNANSFENVTVQWLEHWGTARSPRHVDYVRRRMAADVLPRLGTRPIAEIEAPELVAMAKAIEERGARDIAKRALQTTAQIFRYAIAHGYARRNPAAEIRPSDILRPTRTKNYPRIDGKELPDLLKSIEVYQGRQITRLAMKLMTLTFVRTSELIGAKWNEFDFEAARWDIPESRMKKDRPHIVPLAKQTLEVLEILRMLSGNNDVLFPGDRDPRKSMSNNTILKGLERMGYKGVMTGHGFRGLASTILHEMGYVPEHIELQLAHAPKNAVSAAYNHALYLEPRFKLMQDWADHLERIQRSPKLIPIRERVA